MSHYEINALARSGLAKYLAFNARKMLSCVGGDWDVQSEAYA